MDVRLIAALVAAAGLASACATETYQPLQDYEELDPVTILDAPDRSGQVAEADRETVARGEYLVELLGCGACHTDGALVGAPDYERPLAGSRVGIAWTNPLEYRHPGVVYPSNLTPDRETGIGARTDQELATAIRSGVGPHGRQSLVVMPWQGYSRLSDEDVAAMVAYLLSLEPVRHRVPASVAPGRKATESFVYFGVYRSR